MASGRLLPLAQGLKRRNPERFGYEASPYGVRTSWQPSVWLLSTITGLQGPRKGMRDTKVVLRCRRATSFRTLNFLLLVSAPSPRLCAPTRTSPVTRDPFSNPKKVARSANTAIASARDTCSQIEAAVAPPIRSLSCSLKIKISKPSRRAIGCFQPPVALAVRV